MARADTNDLILLHLEAKGIGSGARVFLVERRGHKWGYLVDTGGLAMGRKRRVKVPVAVLGRARVLGPDEGATDAKRERYARLLATLHDDDAGTSAPEPGPSPVSSPAVLTAPAPAFEQQALFN